VRACACAVRVAWGCRHNIYIYIYIYIYIHTYIHTYIVSHVCVCAVRVCVGLPPQRQRETERCGMSCAFIHVCVHVRCACMHVCVRVCVCAVRVCMRVCVCACALCVYACVCACVRACACMRGAPATARHVPAGVEFAVHPAGVANKQAGRYRYTQTRARAIRSPVTTRVSVCLYLRACLLACVRACACARVCSFVCSFICLRACLFACLCVC
jgi:hypothetical protein